MEKHFFFYCIRERIGRALVLVILATTYLGMAAVWLACLWYGACAGCLMAVSVLRYGLKGMVLLFVAFSPQFIALVPGGLLLLKWCERTYRERHKGYMIQKEAGKTGFLTRRLLSLFGIMLLLILGCFLECFVNPGWIQGFLKIF